MNNLSNPKRVIIIGDNNNIGNQHGSHLFRSDNTHSCRNCPKLIALKKEMDKLKSEMKVKDVLIEYLTNE